MRRNKNLTSYYQSILDSKYRSMTAYESLINDTRLPVFFSRQKIGETHGFSLGDDLRNIRSSLGKPLAVVKPVGTAHLKILFYKLKIDGYKTRQEYHFYKDRLFMYIYHFPGKHTTDFDPIKSLLIYKYFDRKEAHIDNCIVKNDDGCILKIQESLDLNLQYFDANSIMAQQLRDLNIRRQKRKQEIKMRKFKVLYSCL